VDARGRWSQINCCINIDEGCPWLTRCGCRHSLLCICTRTLCLRQIIVPEKSAAAFPLKKIIKHLNQNVCGWRSRLYVSDPGLCECSGHYMCTVYSIKSHLAALTPSLQTAAASLSLSLSLHVILADAFIQCDMQSCHIYTS